MNKQFYMIYVEGKHAPTVKHGTRDQANTEARRLAQANPGKEVYVLKAVQKTVSNNVIETPLQPGAPSWPSTDPLFWG